MSKKKKVLITIGAILATVVITISAYGLFLYNEVNKTVDDMHEPLPSDPEKKEMVEETVDNQEIVNVLVLGVDERDQDVGRSDTMIFASLNPNTNETLMFSIPRDTYVDIPDYGMDKINHAYARGGVNRSVQTVEDFLDVPIHFYAKVNMQGFKDGVDAVGGVTVQNTLPFSHNGYNFPEGEIKLDGDKALSYSRMRKQDPDGDFGRTERQRDILKAGLDKAMSFESFSRVNDILDTVENNVKTNMEMQDMRKLFSNYRSAYDDIKTEQISGNGERLDGIWYLMVDDEENERIQELINEHENSS